MKIHSLVLSAVFSLVITDLASSEPLVIAHRGASGHLPEHTLASAALAHGLGADFIEQDVVMTKDKKLVVLHDITLDEVSDVEVHFPARRRDDGHFYVIDFTRDELRTLSLFERFDPQTKLRRYPSRFQSQSQTFRIATLGEHMELIKSLNRTRERNTGIYVEIKMPAWHRQKGHDIGAALHDELARYGFTSETPPMPIFIQSFDPDELASFSKRFGPKFDLIQLIGDNDWKMSATDFDKLLSKDGLASIKKYAVGIGPWLPQVLSSLDKKGQITMNSMLANALELGLAIHPYTFRTDSLPSGYTDANSVLDTLFNKAKVTGLFADQPDFVLSFLKRR